MSVKDIILAAAGQGSSAEKDPYFANTTLLLQGDVSNPDLSYNAFSDASGNNVNILPLGDARGSSFSPYNTSWGVDFPKSGYLRVPSSAVSGTTTGDITIQVWVNPREFSTTSLFQRIFSFGSGLANDVTLNIDTSGNLVHRFNDAVRVTSSSPLIANTWQLVTFSRASGVVRLFIGSTQVGSYSGSDNYSSASSNDLWIGAEAGSTGTGTVGDFNGFMADFRVRKGVGVTSVTVPTSQFTAESGTSVIACSSNRFIDKTGTTTAFTVVGSPKITGASPFLDTDTTTGSGYFDGSGDYLTFSDTDVSDFGSNPFTFEAWIYKTSSSVDGCIYDGRSLSGNGPNLQITTSSSNKIISYFNGNLVFTSTATVRAYEWTHIALVRGGTGTNQSALFVNGVRSDLITYSGSFTNGFNAIGAVTYTPLGNAPFPGHISNMRIVKGADVYGYTNSSITIPPSPVAVHGSGTTSLLALQTRGAVRNIGFRDESEYNHVITKVGNCAQGTFSPFSQEEGKWSVYFDADRLTYTSSGVAPEPLAPWVGSTGTATIEAWVFPTALETSSSTQHKMSTIISIGDTYFAFGIHATGKLRLYWWTGNQNSVDSTGTVPLNQWSHVAVTRNNSTITFYINGVAAGSSNAYTSISWATASNGTLMQIGQNNGSSTTGHFYGYISNLRTSNNVRSISLPSEPYSADANTLWLSNASNRFRDLKNNRAIAITNDPSVQPFSPFAPSAAYDPEVNGGSAYLDGSDAIESPTDTFNPGAGSATIEMWIYPTTSGVRQQFFWNGNSAGQDSSGNLFAEINSSNQLRFGIASNGTYTFNTGGTFQIRAWNHIVLTKDGATAYGYLNGERVVTNTTSGTANTATNPLQIGGVRSNTPLYGYVSNVRIETGVAREVGATLTVPSAPKTNTQYTNLLLNFTNAGVIDSTGRNVIETVGNAHVETSVKKYGSGSFQFDKDLDYLALPTTAQTYFPGDFTFECWVYPTSYTSYNMILGYSSPNNYWSLRDTGVLHFYDGNVFEASSGAVPLNQWSHVAVSRSGSTLRQYVNGTQVHTATTTAPIGSIGGQSLWVGASASYPNQHFFGGYIDDFRASNFARYVSNFTPPSKSLPNQ